jgi:drug/metabolite transporter (DMT)-like permease
MSSYRCSPTAGSSHSVGVRYDPMVREASGGPSRWAVAGALALVYVAWGATYPAISVLVETVPPLLGTGARFLVAGLLLLAVVLVRGRRGERPDRAARWRSVGLGVWILGDIGLIAWAQQTVPAGVAALVIGSVPLWVVLLQVAGGPRPGPAVLVATAVGFGGLALVVDPTGSGAVPPVWSLVLVVAALLEASGEYATPRVRQVSDPLHASALQMVGAGVVLLVAGAAIGEVADVELAEIGARAVVAFAFLVVVGSVLAYTALVWLLGVVPTSTVATYAYVNPVIALGLGWLLLDQTVPAVALAGAVVVLGSVVVVVSRTPRPAQPDAPATAREESAAGRDGPAAGPGSAAVRR